MRLLFLNDVETKEQHMGMNTGVMVTYEGLVMGIKLKQNIKRDETKLLTVQ